ncbi:MAG: CHASE3 domain-containing protein [Pseudolabrys sp.]|nr:CHASE3 domain-containing protein [Pseudolabrys sp.]
MPNKRVKAPFDWSTLNLQAVLLTVGFVILISISAFTVFVIDRAAKDDEDLARTLSIQDKLTAVLLVARRAESGQRGYLLTQQDVYLQDYNAATPRMVPVVNELRELVRDPALIKVADRMQAIITEKLHELQRTIELQKSGNLGDALALLRTNEGRNIMEELRLLVTDTINSQARIRVERTATSQRNNMLLLILTLAGSALIILIGGTSIVLVQRNYRQAEIARQELAGTNNNLERIVEFRTADLTEANNEIQRFAYIVSHDLRSPLVNIMGFTSELEALRNDIFDEVARLTAEVATLNGQAAAAAAAAPTDARVVQLGTDFDEAIRFIKTSIGNMDRLINAVLKLSREGRRQFHPEKIDMKALLGQVAENVSHRVMELGATLDVLDLPLVESDPLALEQIFTNLVDNAIKYRRTDEPLHITVRGRTTSVHAIYDVEDNGRGIDGGDHQRVFELFRRSGKQDRPGEGIGLAHVRALVRRLGGTMELKSELGQGSTFTVILPLRWSVNSRSAA